jgi:hypothetical protein
MRGWSNVRSAELFGGEIAERRMRALLVVALLQRLSLGGRTRDRTWDPLIKRHDALC